MTSSPVLQGASLAQKAACQPLKRVSSTHRVHTVGGPHKANRRAEEFVSLRLHVQNPSRQSVSDQ